MRLRALILAAVVVASLYALLTRDRHPKLPREFTAGLESGVPITLYSLQPRGGPKIPEWEFRGHLVLGHVEIHGKEAKIAIGALKDAVSAGHAGWLSSCIINPRHGFRFKWKGNTYDILICYQCGQLEIFKNDSWMEFSGSIAGKPDVLNGLLKAAAIPLADDPVAIEKSYIEEAGVALKHAENGDAKAQDVVGKMLLAGRGIKKDEAEGIRWLTKASKASPQDPDFQVKLGEIYEDGWGGELENRNYPAAMNWYRKAADQGSAEGLYKVGYLYAVGEGVAKNPIEAVKWYRLSAEKGNTEAEVALGVRYARGWDLSQDYSEALIWFQKAAEQCDPTALSWMSKLHEEGWGVPKNLIEAFY